MAIRFRPIALAIFILLGATASAWPAPANSQRHPAKTGEIEGRIVLYPAFPVARAGMPDRRGVPGRVAVESAAGVVVAEVASDPGGRFVLRLPPGRYTLRLTSLHPPAASPPTIVTVESGQASRVEIDLDAGIR